MLDAIRDFFSEDERPNKFTKHIGEKIRQAREEAGFSQEKLAQLVYLRRATLSDIENGKSEPNAKTYVHIAHVTNKPLAYFLPDYVYKELKQEDLSPEENELITNYRYHVVSNQFRNLVINIIKAIGKFDVDEFVIEQAPITAEKMKQEEEIRKYNEKKKKNVK